MIESILIGKTYKIKIKGIGDKGTPFGYIDKMVVFVNTEENVAIGDIIKISITSIKNKYCFSTMENKHG